MSITITDRSQIRRTTDLKVNNGIALTAMLASVAMTNPGPLMVDSAGAASNGQPQVKPAYSTAGNSGYIGYNLDPNVAQGMPVSPQRNLIVDGFSGVSPGSPVFIDSTSADNSSTSSGLTHTQPSTGGSTSVTADEQGGTISATATVDIVVPAGATVLTGLDFTTTADAAANDTNYWTFALTNDGTDATGTTVMLAATDANTTKATGGNGGFTANIKTAATLSGTPSNLNVSSGQVLKLTITKTASAPNLSNLAIRGTFTAGSAGAKEIGVGLTTTRIYFYP